MEVIVGKTAGFCYGVKRAVEGAKKEIKNSKKKIYCLGEIVHNKEVVKNLEERGIEFIEKPDEVKQNDSLTIIRAHGIPKQIYRMCNEKSIQIADYTCPKVLRIHEIAEEYNKKGYYIVLIGSKKHPENIGTISFCGEKMSVIENMEDVERVIEEIKNSGHSKCLVIAQTTYHIERFKKIEKMIEERLPDKIQLEVKNTICEATAVRQKETEELSKKVDKMIIIGGNNSSNTKKLYEVAKQNCANSICIETKNDLKKEDLCKCKKIGVMAGASTPRESIEEVVNKIKESSE